MQKVTIYNAKELPDNVMNKLKVNEKHRKSVLLKRNLKN